jgi:hypothetical protein
MEVSNRACARSPTDDSKDVLPPTHAHVDADDVVQDYVGGIFFHNNDTVSTPPPLSPPATTPPPLPTPTTTPPQLPTPATTATTSTLQLTTTTPPLQLTTTTPPLQPTTTALPVQPTTTTLPSTLAPPITILQSCPARGVQDSACVDGIPFLREDACSSNRSEEVCSDVECATRSLIRIDVLVTTVR